MSHRAIEIVSIKDQLENLKTYWDPLIIGELNDQCIKVVKLKGSFVMHHHDNEDEMFMVVRGLLHIEFEDCIRELRQGEIIIIPRGVAHKPVAEERLTLFCLSQRPLLIPEMSKMSSPRGN